MAEVTIIHDGKTHHVPEETWRAFLDASAWVVDSGDIFALLGGKYRREVLESVRETKSQLDGYLPSSSKSNAPSAP